MRSASRLTKICLPCAALLAFSLPIAAQLRTSATEASLLEAPLPQGAAVSIDIQEQTAPAQNPASAPALEISATSGSSSSQAATPQADAQKGKQETADEQLKAQEHQRVMGVMATFNTTRNQNALPLSPKQKFHLFFKSATDPWPFLLAGVVSGIGQADDSYPEWGQGAQGYAKRFGAAYSDSFIGNFFGNAVLPSLLHEDPRYFQKGTGSVTRRILWAASSTLWCRRDKGSWGPNYANVGGNLIGAAIARSYYPASERTVGSTISDGLTVSLEGIAGSELIEFWPDIARHYQRKKAEKLARQQAAQDGAGKTGVPPKQPSSNQEK